MSHMAGSGTAIACIGGSGTAGGTTVLQSFRSSVLGLRRWFISDDSGRGLRREKLFFIIWLAYFSVLEIQGPKPVSPNP